MNRRAFNETLLQTTLSFGLFKTLFSYQLFEAPIRPITRHWAIELNNYCKDLRKNTISPQEWQLQIEELYQKISLEEILQFIDVEQLMKKMELPDLGVNAKQIHFPKLDGLPAQTAFVKKVFGMKKDRAIIPHGHSNMCSAHLVLKGKMHLRQYAKISQDETHMIIQPTVDQIIEKGQASSVSDEYNNVHWFIASSESAFTFDVIMLDLNKAAYDIHNLDIFEQESIGNQKLRVPKLDVETALKKYGKTHH